MARSFYRRLTAALMVLVLCFGLSAARAASPINVLLIGVDAYGENGEGRSDAMLLLRADSANKDVRLLSFLRDLYVPVPGHGKTRLNAAYFYGGEALLRKTLANSFGVTVDRTVTVNFSMVAELIDAVGGVEIELTEAELPYLNDVLQAYNKKSGLSANHGLVTEAGAQLLDGKQALSYSRIRKLDSDFKRVSRQHTVLKAMLTRLTTLDFFTLTRLAASQLNKVQTDLSLWDINALLPLLTAGDELTLRTAQVPFPDTFSEETINGMQVLSADLTRNTQKIKAFWTAE